MAEKSGVISLVDRSERVHVENNSCIAVHLAKGPKPKAETAQLAPFTRARPERSEGRAAITSRTQMKIVD